VFAAPPLSGLRDPGPSRLLALSQYVPGHPVL